ncbi:MAG: B12-binding domain-containing radical SAM protein [Candidatus Rokubacteria bacterium]|nr:B12-binding domain-containing radical SAM protein [Candidatus Rokubacteria bacterium]
MTAARIGLIAVSGVRVYNERLIRLGVTLPGFVERARVIASMPSLGLLTLAAVTPDEYDVTYLESPEFDPATLCQHGFDMVGISSFTAKADVMYGIADFYRVRGTTVVLGGLHATLVPEEAAEHADAVVAGEGEVLWPRVLADWKRGRLDRIYRNRSFRDVDLGRVPVPRYDLLDLERYNRIPLQTARGCPLDCEFCAASKIFGGYKRKPVEGIAKELAAIKRRFGQPFLELADDNTFVDKRWSRDLVRALAAAEVHWFTETDVSLADDPELLDLLAASGCRQVLIGFESPNAESLRGLEAHDWKARRHDRYRRAIDEIQRRGITVNGCFIVGLDNDTPEIFPTIERFVKDSGLMEVQVTVLTPFPGTALYRRLRAEGRLLRERYWERCTLFDVNFAPRRMSVEDLEQGLEYLMGSLYTAEEVHRRRRLYLETTLRNRRLAS